MEDKIKIKVEKFIQKLKEIFGKRLKSCILYGSAVKGKYREGISDINMIVIVDNLSAEDLEKIKKDLSKYAYKNLIKVFYFSEWFLLSSSDVFPVEWSDIKENHIILYGEDLTEKINVEEENMRIELERKIKQLFLDFQQELIFDKDKVRILKETIKNLKFLIPLIERQVKKRIEIDEFFEKEKIKKEEVKEGINKLLKFFTEIIFLIDEGFKKEEEI